MNGKLDDPDSFLASRSADLSTAMQQAKPENPPASRRRLHNRPFKGLVGSSRFLSEMKPPDYLVDGVLQRGASYTLTGNTGHCKTLVALLMAIKVARGDWFCGRKCKPGTVAFFAGENPDNVRVQFFSLCADLGIDGKALPIVWHSGVFNLAQAMEKTRAALAAYSDLAFCVYDSLQAFFTGDDDNQNMAMLNLAVDFRETATGHTNRPVNLILAHPIKNAGRDNLLPRGGSAITAELDGNLTVWLEVEKSIATLHWHGKLRGIPFEPIKLETVVTKPQGLVDAEGNQMSCTVLRHLGEIRASELAQQSSAREIAILTAIKAKSSISERDLATAAGTTRYFVKKEIEALQKRKWLRAYSGSMMLTKEGEIALRLATS